MYCVNLYNVCDDKHICLTSVIIVYISLCDRSQTVMRDSDIDGIDLLVILTNNTIYLRVWK